MGFLQLFYVASVPVIKVLLVSVLGLFLALDGTNILGETARKHVNHIVFYVFNPSLVGTNLAKTITLESFLSLWFMPVNILFTFLLGSALGWILIKITRPPKHLEGLILGCCAAGNLGNLLIIIIPAICKEKGSPFGDPDVCHKYGMAYASLSMATGAVFLWGYVYNIMRISAQKLHKEGNAIDNSCNLEASEEKTESLPDICTEALNPSKDAMDDAYTVLLPCAEPEENTKVLISDKFKSYVRMISRSVNLKAIFAPSTIGAARDAWTNLMPFNIYYVKTEKSLKLLEIAPSGISNRAFCLLFYMQAAIIAGFVIGLIPQLRNILIGSDAPLRVVEDSVSMLGDAAIPTVTLILGANLLKGLRGKVALWSTTVGIIAVRYIFLPMLGVLVIKGAIHFGLVHSDPLYQFILLLQYALPPAMNIGTMAQLFGGNESECSVIMLWTYALASVAVTLWSTYFLWLVS